MNNKYMVLTGIGFELIGLILVAVYLGEKLDKNYGWDGYGVMSTIASALIIWLTHVVYTAKKLEKADNQSSEKPNGKSN